MFFLLSIFLIQNLFGCAITYDLNGGRLGDNLSTYAKAKLFSHLFNIELLYKPFAHSDLLYMHVKEKHYTQQLADQFSKIVFVKSLEDIIIPQEEKILFITNFYTKTPKILYDFAQENPTFAQEIKLMLSPLAPIPLLEKPKDTITIALHVRKGTGFDKPLGSLQQYDGHEHIIHYSEKIIRQEQFSDFIWPTKFPPDQYYIDQIKKISELLDHQPLHIFLFTDDPHPEEIAHRYQKALNKKNISFSYRISGNSHDTNIVEDLHQMASCDCMIRSSSLLAQAAQLLGNHTIIIYPKHALKLSDRIIIDKIGIIKKTSGS